jgi:zinc protease
VASLVSGPAVFAGSGYGHPASGTPQSLPRITREDVARLHAAHYRPDNTVLVLAGDVTPEAGFALAERLFGDWARPAAPLPAPVAAAPANAPRRVVVIDMPNSGQAAVQVVKPGIRRSDPQYFPALVADSVLGGGYSSRLNQEIRIKRGLSYGAGSFLDARRDAGLVGVSTQTNVTNADEVTTLVLAELDRLGREPVAAPELAPRKAVLTGRFGRSVESVSGLAGALGTLAVHGLPVDEINRFLPGVEGVTPEQLRGYAQSALDGNDATVIVVGDAKAFIEPLPQGLPAGRGGAARQAEPRERDASVDGARGHRGLRRRRGRGGPRRGAAAAGGRGGRPGAGSARPDRRAGAHAAGGRPAARPRLRVAALGRPQPVDPVGGEARLRGCPRRPALGAPRLRRTRLGR